ncbi:hypothetical protein ACN23B_15150 [Anabaena sp. FACHB-709]|nr:MULTISPECIES: hypothetical protein [Nostocaceae]HBW28949.1 hypothetical protein [Nostoc sp. UBA8866]MBD2170228.1 hypothetical protein [Anabaena cylindrica FACHB-318]MBD2262290.1 hypothetical protein [Anabaena sp. FACHB-709]MBD2271561.1 hypothetical protein [Nostoc sp. PCC 7120 = FACHB-418]MBD2281849.1 hypothetical protein [Anabaena cylindrica FACHB-170]
MFKKLPFALVAATVLVVSIDHPSTTLAGTCASKCGSRPLQFTPGQRIRLEIINKTSNLVELERVQGAPPIHLQPQQKLQFPQQEDSQPNLSLVFWDETGAPLQAVVSKPNFGTLRVEFHPTWRYPGNGLQPTEGHRSLYILNDGRINVF